MSLEHVPGLDLGSNHAAQALGGANSGATDRSGDAAVLQHSPPTLAVLGALALADHLTIPEIRTRVADGWPEGKLGRTLDLLRERGLIVRTGWDAYSISIEGLRFVRGGAAHG